MNEIGSPEVLKFTLGLKVRSMRIERGWSLKDVASRADLSVSYLSEIEKGKKYPTPEKLLSLAGVLETPYDELVSTRLNSTFAPLAEAFCSDLLNEFPLELFGVEATDIFALITSKPTKTAALIRACIEIGREYGMRLEHFLLAALRSYQQMHRNHFPDLEEAVEQLRCDFPELARRPRVDELKSLLQEKWNYQFDFSTLQDHPELLSFRTIYRDGVSPTFHVNGRLLPSQQAFVLAREIGYRYLDLSERAITSSWVKVNSFEQVLNNFKASYFAGALLLDRSTLIEELKGFFRAPKWDPRILLSMIDRFETTPETLFHRMTDILTQDFGIRNVYFMRFHQGARGGLYRLSKSLNLSGLPLPNGWKETEHYCRRWAALGLMDQVEKADLLDKGPRVEAQRLEFFQQNRRFLEIAMARPLALNPEGRSAVVLGIDADESYLATVPWIASPDLPEQTVGMTCEQCSLSADACGQRRADPIQRWERQETDRRHDAVELFLS